MSNLGEYIKKRRHELGIYSADLAIQAGIATGYISNIENGKRRPSQEVIAKLSEALGEDVKEMEKRADLRSPSNEGYEEALKDFYPGWSVFRDLRIQSNLTFKELSEETGFSEETLKLIEQKGYLFSREDHNRLGEAYGIYDIWPYLTSKVGGDEPSDWWGTDMNVNKENANDLYQFINKEGPLLYYGKVIEPEQVQKLKSILAIIFS